MVEPLFLAILAVLASSMPAGWAAPTPMDSRPASWNPAAVTTSGYSNEQLAQQHEFGEMATPFATPILPFDPFRVNPNAAAPAAMHVQHVPQQQNIPIASSYSHASSYGVLPAAAASYNSQPAHFSSIASSLEAPGSAATFHVDHHHGYAQDWTTREHEARRILSQMNTRRQASSAARSPIVELLEKQAHHEERQLQQQAAAKSPTSIDLATLKRALDEMDQTQAELSETSSQLLGTSPEAQKLLKLLHAVRSASDLQDLDSGPVSPPGTGSASVESPTFFPFDAMAFGVPSVAVDPSLLLLHQSASVDPNSSRSYPLESLLDEVASGDTQALSRVLSSVKIKSSVPIINDIGRDGYGLLHVAAMTKSPMNIALLVQCGANVNLVDAFGRTPIAYADDDADTAITLLSHGANVPRGDRATGGTLLHKAALLQNMKFMQALLAKKTGIRAIDAINEKGDTALHIAARLGDGPMSAYLVKAGASVTVMNDRQWVPVQEAARAGHVRLVAFFLQHRDMTSHLHEKLSKDVSIAWSSQLADGEHPWLSIVAIRDFHYRRDFVTAEELVDAMNLPETSDYFRASMLPVSTESILHGTVFTIRYGRDNEVSHAFLPVGDATSYHLGMWVLVESIDRKRIEIDAAEIIAIERGSSLDIASTSIPMRRIFRPLTTLERDSFNTKRITETIDFHMLKHSLVDGPSPADLELTGLRYQWDKRKAIVYFRSSKTVRFNTLLYKLSMILKMRVHLVAEIGSFVPDGTGRGGKGIQRDTVE